MSQDHIEMLFSAIRSWGGFKNDPSAAQFESAQEKLLIHTNLSVSKEANCLLQDSANILHVSSSLKKKPLNFLNILCIEKEENIEIDEDISDYTQVVDYK